MTLHRPRPYIRALGLLFPAIIVALAAYMLPIFAAAGRPWWPLFILSVPALVSVLVCLDFFAVAIAFDARGVHYQAVGYRIFAPWSGLQLQIKSGKAVLQVTKGERHFAPWLGAMYKMLTLLQPARTVHASRLMTTIPLYLFMTAGADPAMTDLRASAPEGFV